MNTSAKMPEHKQTQAIQSWYEPALYVFNKLFIERQETLRKRNNDVENAAVHKADFHSALIRQYPQLNEFDARELQKSLCKSGLLTYLGSDYLKPVKKDGEV